MDNQRDLTFGQKAAGVSFNPSQNENVTMLKQIVADFIDRCDHFRNTTDSPEIKRMFSVAITEAQTAQMWAVKAVTWDN